MAEHEDIASGTRASERPLANPHAYALVTTPIERKRAFAILFFSLVCMGAGQSVMFAILPSLARQMGLSEFQASLPFVASATIWVFSSGFWGRKSDHWGRKPVMLIGLIAFGISFASFAAVTNAGIVKLLPLTVAYPMMIASRALYGLFGSGTFPSAQAYIADRTTRAERTQGLATINAAFGLGTTIGPGIGAALVVFGLFTPFYFTAAAAFISAGAIWFLLPERTAPRHHAKQIGTLKWHDRRVFTLIIFGLGLSTVGAIPIQTIGYFFIDTLHLKPADASQYVGIGLMASAMAALFAQLVIVQRYDLSARVLIRWGVIIAFISNVGFVIGHQFGVLVLALLLSGLGFGMARPGYGAAASLAVDPHEQGAIAGITGATSGAGFIFGPIIGNGLYELSPVAPYLFGAVLMALLYVYAVLSPDLKRAGEVAPEPGKEATETQVPNG